MKAWLEWPWDRHVSVAVKWGVATLIVVFIVSQIQVLRGYPTATFTFGTHTLVYNTVWWNATVAYLAVIIPWITVVGVGKWAESGLEGMEESRALISLLVSGVIVGLGMGFLYSGIGPLYSNDPAGGLVLTGLFAGSMGAVAGNVPSRHLHAGLFSGLLYGLIIGMGFGLTTGGVLGGLVFCLVTAGIGCVVTVLVTGMVTGARHVIRTQKWKTFLKRFWGWMTS